MNPLHLDVTLSMVGPRARLMGLARWPMALRVTAGFADNPANEAQARELVSRSLPWNVWPADLPDVLVTDEQGTSFTLTPDAPQQEVPAFLASLKVAVEARGHELCAPMGLLSFSSAGGQHADVVDVGGVPAGLPWAGLLKTLTDLCAPTPSALKATWFFTIDRAAVCQVDGAGNWTLRPGATLSAAPAQMDGAAPQSVTASNGATAFGYPDGSRVHCNILSLDASLGHGLDELDNYWLSIRDSRDDSLLDLAERLESALEPSAVLGALRTEELIELCVVADTTGSRRCTSAELAAALIAWKGAMPSLKDEAAHRRREIVRETLLSTGEPAIALRGLYRTSAGDLLQRIMATMPAGPVIEASKLGTATTLLSERLLPAFFERMGPGVAKSGEGVQLVVGDERLRLAHESRSATPAIDDIAAIQLFGRRSSDARLLAPDAAAPAAWHPLTAGRYAPIGSNAEADGGVERVFGCGTAYEDGVLYREYGYYGANMVCRNPLENAHREVLEDSADPQDVSLLLAPTTRVVSRAWELKALPLRYGDHYEFAASVVDRAGGQALELCRPDQPWIPDITALKRLNPPQRDRLHFLRRVPVGTCNVLPPSGGWPQTPPDVALRCLEEAGPVQPGKRASSICLVPQGAGFNVPVDDTVRSAWPSEVSFSIAPPQTDEHTAIRWHMPATDIARDEQFIGLKLVADILKRILQRRDDRLNGMAVAEGDELVTDPAVTGIGLRWQADGLAPVEWVLPAQTKTLTVKTGERTERVNDSTFTVAPGSWLRIGIHALVERSDFARMDSVALSSLVEEKEWADDKAIYRAFEEDVVFVESATDAVMQPDAQLLALTSNPLGDVEVRYAFSRMTKEQQDLRRHLHGMRLDSHRWKWRNLPLPAQRAGDISPGTAEWRRRLASGPPRELADPDMRDSAPEVVGYYDVLAAVDQGFVNREAMPAEYPRGAQDATVLFTDRREGITAADYLRYTWTVRSRYAGVLKEPERRTGDLRRIALGFRGDASRIKPPRILAVIPLLQQLHESPRESAAGDGTPFLVIFDEIWFREYGLGERLGARVAKVKREIDEATEPTERRYGPLPDHNCKPQLTEEVDVTSELDCFGPFGFSLDRTDDQALSNAVGFVVYPPKGTPAHYNLFVEFQRLLDLPSGSQDAKGVLQPYEKIGRAHV